MDTNTLVSAIGWDGPPHRLLDACLRGRLDLYISPAIVEELTDVLTRPKLAVIASHPDLPVVIAWLCEPSRLVIPRVTVDIIREDPDDNRVIECGLEARADAVVTGDEHLLKLGTYEGMAFLSPHDACARWGF